MENFTNVCEKKNHMAAWVKETQLLNLSLFKILISDDVPDNILSYLLLPHINPLSVMSSCLIFEVGYQVLL